MRDFDEHTITEAVVKSFQSTPDPRLQQLLSSLTRHLHAYVQEVEPTIEEWDYAIDYLTRTGRICDDKRQEYILRSAEHTSELQSLIRISYAVFCLKKKNKNKSTTHTKQTVLPPSNQT